MPRLKIVSRQDAKAQRDRPGALASWREKTVARCDEIEHRYFPAHLWPADVYKKVLSEKNRPGLRVAHLGCGHDRVGVRNVLKDAFVIGLDVDRLSLSRISRSPCALANLEAIPARCESLDLLVSEFVFEHLERPERVIAECARILRPGGELVFLTINKNSIPGRLAAWTPFAFHRWINRLRPIETHEADLFPTFYRLNTYRSISRLMDEYGLEQVEFRFLEASFAYLEFSPFLYRLGCRFNRWLLQHESLRGLRTALLGVYRKV